MPFNKAPPPVSTIPRSTISAASSGGVFSRTPCTISTICAVSSFKATRISSEVKVATLGSPVTTFLPFTSIVFPPGRSQAVPILILILSAVCSPINRLCALRTYLIIDWSKLSPATLIELNSTTSPREMIATSVVPPPISTTIFPNGFKISIPEPIAAAIGSSIR